MALEAGGSNPLAHPIYCVKTAGTAGRFFFAERADTRKLAAFRLSETMKHGRYSSMISSSGKNSRTVNLLKIIQFDRPGWVPAEVGIMPAAWMKYREDIEKIVLRHGRLFPGYRKGSKDFDEIPGPLYEEGLHTDCWGSVWRNIQRGLDSIVVREPLADWADFKSWRPPDPFTDDLFGPRDWQSAKRSIDAARCRGEVAMGSGLPHGFFYMRLMFLRGFEGLMLDMASGDSRLDELIAIVENYNVAVLARFLEMGVECVACGEDLGMQHALPMSPQMWRKFIKPSYEAIFGPCRDRGVPVFLHTDGHILEIIDDLIDTGVRMLNPQVRANGLSGLVEQARGKVAIKLDLDRQLFPFATPREIEDHIEGAFEALYMKEGGLMLYAEIEPDVPLENIETICSTLESVCRLPEADTI